VVYTGKGTSFVDAPLQDGIEYRYTVVSFDASGNRSAGAVITTSPGRALLLAPRDGARIKSTKTIRLSWARVPQADYYNVQLYFVSGLKANSLSKGVAETKVLSVWPKKNLQVLSKKWKFAGKRRLGRLRQPEGRQLRAGDGPQHLRRRALGTGHPAECAEQAHERENGERESDRKGEHQSLPVPAITP
jgi:hypothetical protein